MAQVVWLSEAIDQLDLIVAYIELFDPAAAQRVRDRLVRTGESLSDFPNRGRPVGDGIRQMTTVPPYVLSYEVVDDTAYILGIRHGARRPLGG